MNYLKILSKINFLVKKKHIKKAYKNKQHNAFFAKLIYNKILQKPNKLIHKF